MGVKKKKQTVWYMGEYARTKHDDQAYWWCIKNNIYVAPLAEREGSWWVEIIIGDKVSRSPQTYGRVAIWEKIYEFYRYYYDKRNKV